MKLIKIVVLSLGLLGIDAVRVVHADPIQMDIADNIAVTMYIPRIIRYLRASAVMG